MSTAITTFGTSEWLLLISHGMRLTGHSGAALYDRLSRTCCCLLGVGRSLGTKQCGKDPLSYGWIGQESGSGFSDLAPSILHYNWF